ncbi:MAG: sodium:calcium antiporter [Alphaproteobacteria bacterium]|nr:MAG: sodium:calcium antiporter [Alphaproteobacteria bacterium]
MVESLLEFAAGLLVVILGAALLVRGAAVIKRRLRVPDFVIGLLLVGFATSLPEFVIAAGAMAIHAPGLAMGTLIGSNIVNMLLIPGLVAVIVPLGVDRRALGRDGIAMMLASLALVAVAMTGRLDMLTAMLLVLALLFYLTAVGIDEHLLRAAGGRLFGASAGLVPHTAVGPGLAVLMIAGGGAALIIGAGWLVEASAGYAIDAGISESLLGLSLVAVATSAPEFVTSLAAARRGHPALALGNVMGSNIFNILAGVGMVAGWPGGGIAFPADLASLDVAVLVGSAVLFLFFIATERCLDRIEGAILVLLYGGYLTWRLMA